MPKMPTIMQDWVGIWHRYRWWIVGFTIAALFDAFSTMSFMLADRTAEELHPAVGLAASWFGPILGPFMGAIGKLGSALLVCVYLHRYGRIWPVAVLLAGIFVSFWAWWYNLWGYALYVPRLLVWLD